ncbi:MAG: phage tail protein [Sphingobacteriales bacterium]
MDPYLGCIIIFGGNFAIYGFQMCNGQVLPISQYTALFSIIGTYYGGNGTSNFALPDLRGRTAIQQGQGPGLSDYVVGETTGTLSVTLLSNNLPSHNHLVNAVSAQGGSTIPTSNLLGEGKKTGSGPSAKAPSYYIAGTAPNQVINPLAISTNVGGGSNPVSVTQPYLAVTHLIAMTGIFPTRN